MRVSVPMNVCMQLWKWQCYAIMLCKQNSLVITLLVDDRVQTAANEIKLTFHGTWANQQWKESLSVTAHPLRCHQTTLQTQLHNINQLVLHALNTNVRKKLRVLVDNIKITKTDQCWINTNNTSVSRHVSCFETISRHGFSRLSLGLDSTLVCLVLALSRVSMSCHVSCLCLSGIAKCLAQTINDKRRAPKS